MQISVLPMNLQKGNSKGNLYVNLTFQTSLVVLNSDEREERCADAVYTLFGMLGDTRVTSKDTCSCHD